MAFRGTEIMVIVRGQNYASQMLRRVSGDLGGVTSAAASANARLAATQAKIVASVAQQAKLQKAVNEGPARIATNRAVVDAKAQQAALALQGRRNTLQKREQTLVDGVGQKHESIANTQQRINKLTSGSTATKNAKDLAAVQEKQLAIKQEQYELDQRASTLQKNLLTQQATQLRLINRAKKEDIGFRSNIAGNRLEQISAGAGSTAQQIMAKQLLANRIAIANTQEKIAALPATQVAEQTALNAKAAILEAEEERILQVIGEQGVEVERLTRLLATQQGQLVRINERLASIKEEYAAIGAQEDLNNAQNAKAVAGLQAQEAELEALKLKLVQINTLIRQQLPAELANNAALVKQAELTDKINRVRNVGSLTSHVGRVAQFGGLIGTAALGATALNYAHFTSETTQAATQMANISSKGFGDVTVKAKTLQSVILNMMKQFPANAQEQANAAYNLFSSIPALNGPGGEQKGFALLDAANRAAVAGNTTLDVSTSALIKTMNNFGDEGQSVNQILNRMFAIVRFGNMHFADFDSMLNQIAPAAKGAGQTLNDLAGVIAESTIHMAPAQAATGIARLLQIFQRKQFVEGAAALKVPITVPGDPNKLLPIVTILDKFAKAYPGLKEGGLALANLFKEVTAASGKGAGTQGTIQAQKLLNILITNLPELHKLQSETINDNAEFARSYAAMSQTAGVKWSIFMNLIRASVIQIGQTVIPIFEKIGGRVKSVIDWFDNLSPHTRKLVGDFAAWSAIGLLVGGTLLHLGGIIITLGASIFSMSKYLTLARAGWLGLALILIPLSVHFLGLKNTLEILAAIIAGISVQKLLVSLIAIDTEAVAAGFAITGMEAALLDFAALAAIPVIITVITLEYKKKVAGALFHVTGLEAAANYVDKAVPFLGKLDASGGLAPWQIDPKHYSPPSWMKTTDPAAYKNLQGGLGKKAKTPVPGLEGPATKDNQKKAKELSNVDKWLKLLNDPKAFAKYEKGLKDSSALQQQLNDLMNQGTNNLTTLGNTAAQRADQVAAAETKMQTKIQSVVQNLMTLFNNFQQVNEQTFGTLFGGPVTAGPIGQAYANLAQYNIAPPIKLLIQDQTQQANQFEAYRKQLTKLRKRGVPQAMIDELQSLGSAGRLDVQTLSTATQAQIATVIKEWKRKKGDIQDATTIDFNSKLKEYESYGKQTMWAILTGMKSQTEWLSKGFTKYVLTDTLGAAFTKWVNQQFPNLVKNAGIAAGKAFDQKKTREATAKAGVTGKKATPTITTLPGGGKTTTVKPITLSEHQQALVEQAKQIIAGLKIAFTIAKATGDKATAKKDFQGILEHKAELKRLQQGKTAIPKGEHWSTKLGKWVNDVAKTKIPAKTKKAAGPQPTGAGGPIGGPPPTTKGLTGPAGKNPVITKEIHHHNETTELHVHGQVGESLQAAGRRLLFEHQVGVRRRRAMKPGHP